nr:12753_t:CDS:10 [Entrophospora candida]
MAQERIPNTTSSGSGTNNSSNNCYAFVTVDPSIDGTTNNYRGSATAAVSNLPRQQQPFNHSVAPDIYHHQQQQQQNINPHHYHQQPSQLNQYNNQLPQYHSQPPTRAPTPNQSYHHHEYEGNPHDHFRYPASVPVVPNRTMAASTTATNPAIPPNRQNYPTAAAAPYDHPQPYHPNSHRNHNDVIVDNRNIGQTTPTYLAPPTAHHTHHQQQIVYPATNQVTLHHSENNSNVSTRSPSPVPPPSHSINYQNSNIKANNTITNANTNNDNANSTTATMSSNHNKPKKRQSSRSPPPVIKNPIKKSKKNRDNDNIKIEVEPNNNNNIKLEVDVKMEEDVINNNGRTMVDSSSISESTFNDIIVDSKEIVTNSDNATNTNSLLNSNEITEKEQEAIFILNSFRNNNNNDNLNNYVATIDNNDHQYHHNVHHKQYPDQQITEGKADMIEQLISNRVRKLSIQEYDEDDDKKDSSTSNVDNKKLSSIKVEGKQKDKVKETTATKKRDKKDNSKSSFSPTEPSPTKSSPLKSSSEKKNGKTTTITSAKVNNNKITNIINGNKNKAANTPDSDTDLAMDDESEEEEIEQLLVVDKKMKQSQQSRNNKQPLHVIRNLATGESAISTTYNANNSNNNNGLSKLRTTSTISNNSKDDDNFLIKSEESPSSLTNNNNGCVATSSRKSSSSSSRKGSTSSTESNKDTASSTTTIASITNTVSSALSSGNRNTSISSLSSTVTTNGRARPSPTRRKSTIRENDERLELAAIEWEKNIEIPHHIWEETLRIFEIVKHSKEMKNRQPHRKRNHILASILFILCRRNGLPRTFVEICQAASIRKQEIGTYYRLMQKVFESNGLGGGNHGVPRTVDSSEYLKRWCQNLKLPDHILNAAIHVYRQASELNITTGKCPVSVGAASIWLSISSWNESRTIWNATDDQEVIKCEHKDVASAAGVVNATLVGCFKNLSKFKEQLLPSGFIEEAKKRSPFPNRMSVWLPPNNNPNKNHAVINNNGSNSSADGGINNGNANGANNYNVNNNNTVVTYTTSPTRIHNNDDDLPMNVVESQDDELEDGELRESEAANLKFQSEVNDLNEYDGYDDDFENNSKSNKKRKVKSCQ